MNLVVKIFFFLSFAFISCEVKVNTHESVKENNKIRNNVQLEEKNLKVEQAFLIFEDGKLVPADNKVEINQWVGLRLIIKGWQQENGKVFVDAEEQMTTNEGKLWLNEKDLFKEFPDGLNAKDAEIITISIRITAIDKLYDYFKVAFRVWDKKGKGEINGSYKLFLK